MPTLLRLNLLPVTDDGGETLTRLPFELTPSA
jgi:hypothetical protein